MSHLRQFHLEFPFAGARSLREDIENERCSIEDLALEQFLEVAGLCGGQFVVEDHRVDALRSFEELGVLEQDPELGAATGGQA